MDRRAAQAARGKRLRKQSRTSLRDTINQASSSRGAHHSAINNQSECRDDDNISETSSTETIRDRRGFRPLSVLTRSVFFPMDFDAVKAMEEIEQKEKMLAARESAEAAAEEVAADESSSIQQLTPSSTSRALAALPFSNNSELSLRTFLAQSNPANQEKKTIRAPFAELTKIPPPDIGLHPAFASDPFKTQSDLPNLVTTSTREEIKDFAKNVRQTPSHSARKSYEPTNVLTSANRGHFTFAEQRYDPQTPGRKISLTNPDTSPLADRKLKHRSTDVTSPEEEDHKKTSGGRLRKISTIFKPRTSTDKADSPSSMSSEETRTVNPRGLEYKLRTTLNAKTYVYTSGSWYPQHPNTGRAWHSRNLKCTNCPEASCGSCHRTCCAYKAVVLGLEIQKDNPEEWNRLMQAVQEITLLFPYGQELPTFIQCTRGSGGKGGCGKMVCPDCAGMCPDEACADIQCRRCKRDPWGFCEWHKSTSQAVRRGEHMNTEPSKTAQGE